MRATKAKGMWVGGNAPLGYDLKFGKLVPNEQETKIVTKIFETYLESTGADRLPKQTDRNGDNR